MPDAVRGNVMICAAPCITFSWHTWDYGSSEKLDTWLRLIEREGDVLGLAELGN
ncbi:hypothetical protein AB3X96_40350 [Paraburkholderia sp. BR13439]|uniref:hypothetical protein n=1 Tax=Paraburkholderia TaxID=1822464 RepID=UPI001FE36D69|nr:hypothetical protein [Paraburkholderia youngii]